MIRAVPSRLVARRPTDPARASAALSGRALAALRESVAAGGATPVYHRLELTIRELLDSGILAPPDRLPPETQFAKLLHIDRGTIRRALRQLERDGLVDRTPGRGTTLTRPVISGQ